MASATLSLTFAARARVVKRCRQAWDRSLRCARPTSNPSPSTRPACRRAARLCSLSLRQLCWSIMRPRRPSIPAEKPSAHSLILLARSSTSDRIISAARPNCPPSPSGFLLQPVATAPLCPDHPPGCQQGRSRTRLQAPEPLYESTLWGLRARSAIRPPGTPLLLLAEPWLPAVRECAARRERTSLRSPL